MSEEVPFTQLPDFDDIFNTWRNCQDLYDHDAGIEVMRNEPSLPEDTETLSILSFVDEIFRATKIQSTVLEDKPEVAYCYWNTFVCGLQYFAARLKYKLFIMSECITYDLSTEDESRRTALIERTNLRIERFDAQIEVAKSSIDRMFSTQQLQNLQYSMSADSMDAFRPNYDESPEAFPMLSMLRRFVLHLFHRHQVSKEQRFEAFQKCRFQLEYWINLLKSTISATLPSTFIFYAGRQSSKSERAKAVWSDRSFLVADPQSLAAIFL